MKNTKRILALLLVAAAGTQCLTGCGDKKKKSSSSMPLYAETAVETPTEPPVGGAEISGDNYNPEEYSSKIEEHVNAMEITDGDLVLGSVSDEVITPEEGSPDAQLGNYRLSSSGIKLYFDENEYPADLILTFEKYFTAYSSADYDTYHKCLFPGYVTEMEAVQAENEDRHDFKTSFIHSCSDLAQGAHGDFKITRIKLEKNAPRTDGVDNVDGYFQMLNNYLGKDYYSEVKEQCDGFVDACFYIMGEDAYGKENMIVTAGKIVFATKDGRYYIFG
jgi:hypothetical protein